MLRNLTNPFTLAVGALISLTSNTLAGSSLAEALEFDIQEVSVSSSEPSWECTAAGAFDGVDAAVSPEIGDDSTVSFSIAVQGPEEVSFWWKVSSEEDTDTLGFTINGDENRSISGEVAWSKETINLPIGTHVLRWQYTKDDTFEEGQDRGWVDQIRLASKSRPLVRYSSFVGGYVGEPFEIVPEVTGNVENFSLLSPLLSGLQLDPQNGRISGTPDLQGQATVSVFTQNSTGSSEPDPFTINIAPALGSGHDPFVTGWQWAGDTAWTTQQEISHDGIDALRSASIGDNKSSSLILNVIGPAQARFWWRVDSEEGQDQLALLIDGVVADDISGRPMQISGFQAWERREVVVPSGKHTLAWRYQKDSGGVDGDDAAWLDEVEIIDSRDSDLDGIPNIIEALLGTDWESGVSNTLPLPILVDDRIEWRLTKGNALSGIVPEAEISYDLKTWSAQALEMISETETSMRFRERTNSNNHTKFVRIKAVVR